MLVADLLFGLFRGPGHRAVWDGPSSGSSFLGLFLGGISWVFSRAHKWWVPILGFGCWKLLKSNGKGKLNSNEKRKVALKARQIATIKSQPLGSAHAGLFIWEVKGLTTMP
jgi:hypothetical protein